MGINTTAVNAAQQASIDANIDIDAHIELFFDRAEKLDNDAGYLYEGYGLYGNKEFDWEYNSANCEYVTQSPEGDLDFIPNERLDDVYLMIDDAVEGEYLED